MSGYDLTKMIESSVAHAWNARHSQIYPELGRLLDADLITIVDEGARRRKVYGVTNKGLKEVRHWLLEYEPDTSSRNPLALRTFFLWLLSQEEAQELLDNERDAHQAQLDLFEQIDRTFARDAWPPNRISLQWGIRYERELLKWIDWAKKRIAQRDEPPTPIVAHRRPSAPTRTASSSTTGGARDRSGEP